MHPAEGVNYYAKERPVRRPFSPYKENDMEIRVHKADNVRTVSVMRRRGKSKLVVVDTAQVTGADNKVLQAQVKAYVESLAPSKLTQSP